MKSAASRFGCPSAALQARSLLRRSPQVLWAALLLALGLHAASTVLVRGFHRQQEAPKPLTTRFVKRQPRLSKPLELKKRPAPKSRAVRREMVAVRARMPRGQVAVGLRLREALRGLARPRVVDSVGSPGTIERSFEVVRPLGHVVVAGYQPAPQTVGVHAGFTKELTVHFPAGVERERMLATVELFRKGKMRVEPLVTHRFRAPDFGKACRLLGTSSGEYLGILVDWTGG